MKEKKKKEKDQEEALIRFLQSIEDNQMLDDHGQAIIGQRGKTPVAER